MEKIGMILGIALISSMGCKRAQPPAQAPAPPPSTNSHPASKNSLQVIVQPATSITILLDGDKVAESSPYATTAITPGPHTLEVRGMGFYPITLPLVVQDGVPLQVPVALRARSSTDFNGQVVTGVPEARSAIPAAGPAEQAEAPAPATAAAVPPPAEPGAYQELPRGMVPIDVAVLAQPPAPISVDGHPSDGHSVRLRHLKGLLSIGSMALAYEILPGSAVELLIPMDGAGWFKDEQQLKGSSIIKFSHGTVHLRRTEKGAEQSTSIRRLD